LIIVIIAALIILHRYHELGAINRNELLKFLNNELNKGDIDLTKPVAKIVYKKKMTQSATTNRATTLSVTNAWNIWQTWPQSIELYTEKQFNSSEMKDILSHMATAPIVRFDVGHRGTQLKALVELEGRQLAVFKPKRYHYHITILNYHVHLYKI